MRRNFTHIIDKAQVNKLMRQGNCRIVERYLTRQLTIHFVIHPQQYCHLLKFWE